MLTKDVAIIFVVVFVVEAALIILGNAFTIFVFSTPTRTSHIRRTCYLLINLAVADLLVGITEPIILGMEKYHQMTATTSNPRGINETNPLRGKRENGLPGAMQLFASSASVFFLALISLERAFAVLKPLRHRVVSTRVYIYSIVVVWAVGIFIFGLMALSFYYPKLARETVHVVVHFCLFISFVMICASYLKIRTRLSSTAPEVAAVKSRQTTEHNARLSRTLFVVIALSLLFWLPAFAVYIGRDICKRCFHPYVVWTVNVFPLANSLVNPFVYSFRMPAFKEALEKLSRRQRHVIGTRNIEATSLALSPSSTSRMNHTGFSAAATCGGSQLNLFTESGDQLFTATSPKLSPAVSGACIGAKQTSTPSTSIVTRL